MYLLYKKMIQQSRNYKNIVFSLAYYHQDWQSVITSIYFNLNYCYSESVIFVFIFIVPKQICQPSKNHPFPFEFNILRKVFEAPPMTGQRN